MIKIWDNHNKQWLEPMKINFGKDGIIWRVTACKPGEDPISDGWYSIIDDGLKKIAIIGDISMNVELIPKPVADGKDGFVQRLKENIRNAKTEEERQYHISVGKELFFDWNYTGEKVCKNCKSFQKDKPFVGNNNCLVKEAELTPLPEIKVDWNNVKQGDVIAHSHGVSVGEEYTCDKFDEK